MSSLAPAAAVVVVAAGASRRMGGMDKLQLPLAGRPLLAWTLDAVAAARSVRQLIVVVAPGRVRDVRQQPWLRRLDAQVVEGRDRRQGSVAAGVEAAAAEVVLVHDGARPLVTPKLVDAVAAAAARHGAAIPVVPVVESLRCVDGERVVGSVERDGVYAAQTPQGARRELLLEAFAANDPAGPRTFTDEAAFLQASGIPVTTVPGEASNLKVTLPADAEIANALLAARRGAPRAGHGWDSHPFGPEDGLALGGIVIGEAPRMHGHSDGDAVLHAVADALLGATSLGDIGRLFPPGRVETRGIPSSLLVRDVVRRVSEVGWRPAALDVTITAARPRFGSARLDSMRVALAELLGLPTDAVGIKATTANLAGPEGAGLAISASALVTVVPR